ncbi:MAG: BON domain-containing protein [Pseudomonadota bacterium]
MTAPTPLTLRFIAAGLAALIVSACAVTQPGRSVGRELDDQNASLSIKAAMLRAEGYALNGVDVEVTEGVALLTGSTPREEDRTVAECLAWSAQSVRTVANQVVVGDGRGVRGSTRDGWITQQVRTRLLGDRGVRSVNFNVETRDGVVHLLGFARTQAERDRAAAHASLVDGVQQVLLYVRVAGQETALEPRGERMALACENPDSLPGAGGESASQ